MAITRHISQSGIRFLTTLLLTITPLCVSVLAWAHPCGELADTYEDKFPLAATALRNAEAFAAEHNLPVQILEMGPARTKRAFIGLDMNNAALELAYLQRFNLDSKEGGIGGYIPLEFQRELGDRYVTGVFRPSADPQAKIYRWGNPDLPRPAWQQQYFKDQDIVAFGHMIPISPKMRENISVFLNDKYTGGATYPTFENRAACKGGPGNCVAWTASIELGKTLKGTPDAEREFLFTYLGMSRAMAHFEIGRRLTRAANENHSVVFVFYRGAAGREAFDKNLQQFLPPDPKQPYLSIIKGLLTTTPAADAAMAGLPDGMKVFMPIAAGASPEAMASLIAKAAKGDQGMDVHVLVNGVSETLFRRGVETTNGKFRVHALFLGGNLRKLYTEGRISVIPGNLADFSRFVGDPATPQFNYDAVVVRVSPPNAEGRYSLGPNADHVMTVIKKLPNIKIIAEVNPNVPFTTGDNYITADRIFGKFDSDAALAGPPVVPVNEIDAAIGKHIATLIPSDATIQLGIGNVFGGLGRGVRENGVRGLKIHTEMFGDALKELMDDGVAATAVTGFAYGSEGLYKWLHLNPNVVFKETVEVNDPGLVSNIPLFHAVNTALQVDLFGQSNATIGPDGKRMSSPGGQVEFMTGAARSQGGKAIIAIRSTAKGGEISSIVMNLYPGPITTPHESVTHVVTEIGVAELRGKSERERAIALINVAHPKFRMQLFQEAVTKGLVQQADGPRIKQG